MVTTEDTIKDINSMKTSVTLNTILFTKLDIFEFSLIKSLTISAMTKSTKQNETKTTIINCS